MAVRTKQNLLLESVCDDGIPISLERTEKEQYWLSGQDTKNSLPSILSTQIASFVCFIVMLLGEHLLKWLMPLLKFIRPTYWISAMPESSAIPHIHPCSVLTCHKSFTNDTMPL